MIPQYIQWTIPRLLYQIIRKKPLVHKGLNQSFAISYFCKGIHPSHTLAKMAHDIILSETPT